jgi:hypothetical protein
MSKVVTLHYQGRYKLHKFIAKNWDGSALILKLARNVAILASISFIIIPIILFMLMNKHVKRGST